MSEQPGSVIGNGATTAPWTDKQVKALRVRQGSGAYHPYTCGTHTTVPLVPTKEGWICGMSHCKWRQTWAWDADLTFKP